MNKQSIRRQQRPTPAHSSTVPVAEADVRLEFTHHIGSGRPGPNVLGLVNDKPFIARRTDSGRLADVRFVSLTEAVAWYERTNPAWADSDGDLLPLLRLAVGPDPDHSDVRSVSA